MVSQDFIDLVHIDVLAHVGSQLVILFFFESRIVKRLVPLADFAPERFQQEIDKRGIVEDAVDVGAHALAVNEIAVFAPIIKV